MAINELHVIFGTGPVGCWTARSLLDRGLPVRAVNRSARRPRLMPAEVEMKAADLSVASQAPEVAAPARLWSIRRSGRPTTSGNLVSGNKAQLSGSDCWQAARQD